MLFVTLKAPQTHLCRRLCPLTLSFLRCSTRAGWFGCCSLFAVTWSGLLLSVMTRCGLRSLTVVSTHSRDCYFTMLLLIVAHGCQLWWLLFAVGTSDVQDISKQQAGFWTAAGKEFNKAQMRPFLGKIVYRILKPCWFVCLCTFTCEWTVLRCGRNTHVGKYILTLQ